MGLFGNKKKDASSSSEGKDSTTLKKSRVVISPGGPQKHAPQKVAPKAAAGEDLAVFDEPMVQAPAAKGAQAKSDSPPAATGRAAKPTPGAPNKPVASKPASAPVAKQTVAPPPAAQVMQAEMRPVTRAQGRPAAPAQAPSQLQFSGSIAEVSHGPVRTGDQVLLRFLLEKKQIITEEQIRAATNRASDEGLAIDQALIRNGAVAENDLIDALTHECCVPHLKIEKYAIRKKSLSTLSREDAVRYSILPVDKLGSILNLAMVNPLDEATIRFVEQKTGLDVKKVVVGRSELDAAIAKYYDGASDLPMVSEEGSRSFAQDTAAAARARDTAAASAPKAADPFSFEVSEVDESVVTDIDDILSADAILPEPIAPMAASAPIEDVGPVISPIEDAVPSFMEQMPLIEDAVPPSVLPPASNVVAEPAPVLPIAESVSPKAPAHHPVLGPLFEDIEEDLRPSDLRDDVGSKAVEQRPQPVAASNPFNLDESPRPAKDKSDLIDVSDLFAESTPLSGMGHGKPAPAPVERKTVESSPFDTPLVPMGAQVASPQPTTSKPVAPKPTTPSKPATPQQPVTSTANKPLAGRIVGSHSDASDSKVVQASKPATAAFTANRILGKQQVGTVSLSQVSEEEFHQAVTHGRARTFEKWLSLQTRARIINAQSVEEPVTAILAPLYRYPIRCKS
jgi:hypothetical protein